MKELSSVAHIITDFVEHIFVYLVSTESYPNQNIQDTQRTHNVTLRRVRESFLPRKSNKYYIFLCVLARACVRVGAQACGPVHVHACM